MQLYIGIDNELSDTSLNFLPWELLTDNDDDSFANQCLTKKYKYCLMRCACNLWFNLNQSVDNNSSMTVEETEVLAQIICEEHRRRKEGVEKLFSFLLSNVTGDNCELLSFWIGEHKMEYHDILDLRGLVLGDTFEFFKRGQYVIVYK